MLNKYKKDKFIDYCERLCDASEDVEMSRHNEGMYGFKGNVQDRIKIKTAFLKWFKKQCQRTSK